ncbi:hypothetical protein AK812_SmicGene38954 [Symbiodinium microadriaticum]|uniref:Uncharacterized protein n=1 Tax=Symbiodinium microadriaticum TaxID=2951 RepID=A0A1Q9CCF1_SYMMI|nr:hypothetical protein AK812_SmicGene38954 [Symbiodinium microadriaticum]CAE7866193.1 unnamed protein product [Symbiodinium sp. KB8]CAE7893015.1 unnamed protein product [Symbiodinium microadriaticum]
MQEVTLLDDMAGSFEVSMDVCSGQRHVNGVEFFLYRGTLKISATPTRTEATLPEPGAWKFCRLTVRADHAELVHILETNLCRKMELNVECIYFFSKADGARLAFMVGKGLKDKFFGRTDLCNFPQAR